MLILQRTVVIVLIVASSSALSQIAPPRELPKLIQEATLADYTVMCEQNKPLNNPKYMCCGNEVYNNTADQVCCINKAVSTKTNLCCSGVILPKTSDQDTCCGTSVFNINTHHCCQGNIIDRLNDDSACCGGSAFNVRYEFCCEEEIHRRLNGRACCGDKIYDTRKEMCCGRTLHNIHEKIRNDTRNHKNLRNKGRDHYMPPGLLICCGERAFALDTDIQNTLFHECEAYSNTRSRLLLDYSTIDSCGDKKFDALKQSCNDGILTDLSENTTDCLTMARKMSRGPSSLPDAKLHLRMQYCCQDKMATIVASHYRYDFDALLHLCKMGVCNKEIYDTTKNSCEIYEMKEYLIPIYPRQEWCGKPGELSYDPLKQICCRGRYVHLDHSSDPIHFHLDHIIDQSRVIHFQDREYDVMGEDAHNKTFWQESAYPPYVLNTPPLNLIRTRYKTKCCDLQTYNSDEQICCAYKLIPKSATSACCGNAQYNPETKLCCETVLYPKNESLACCGNDVYLRNGNESCLNGVRVTPSTQDMVMKGQETWKH